MRGIRAVLTHKNVTMIKQGEFPAKAKRFESRQNKRSCTVHLNFNHDPFKEVDCVKQRLKRSFTFATLETTIFLFVKSDAIFAVEGNNQA